MMWFDVKSFIVKHISHPRSRESKMGKRLSEKRHLISCAGFGLIPREKKNKHFGQASKHLTHLVPPG